MKKFSLTLFMCLCGALTAFSQHKDSWEVTVNSMDSQLMDRISRVAEDIQSKGGADRSLALTMLTAAGTSAVSSLIDITSSEVMRLATYRQTQKKEWSRMIEKECSYADSISSVKGLNDFYSSASRYGALDPSGMNFDGISLRGERDGQEVLFLSCHIDTTRLDHLFRHSKFFLVLDTLCFHPYQCHLPNLSANGIRLSKDMSTERDNSFSYTEREGLNIGMELVITSSWINEAVMVQKDVELGRFKMNVRIPQGTDVYVYSRKEALKSGDPVIEMSGDSFVVPRSYMPLSGDDRMWGTGEYNVNIRLAEKCRFSQDKSTNAKLKDWHKDYTRLRKMQNKGSQFTEYLETLWRQNGNNFVKTTVKQTLTAGVNSSKNTTAAPSASRK